MSNELVRILEKYPNKIGQYSYALSTNGNISFDQIQRLAKAHEGFGIREWHEWHEWERNPNIPLEYIKSKGSLGTFRNWRGNLVMANPNLTLDYIKEHEAYVEWEALSGNPSLSLQWLLAFPNKAWNWDMVSACPNITPEQVWANSQLPWNYSCGLSRNPSVTMEFIEENPSNSNSENRWDTYYVSMNPNFDVIHYRRSVGANEFAFVKSPMVTIENAILELDKRADVYAYYKGISENQNLTLRDIIRYMSVESDANKILDWGYLSRNPSLKLEWIDAFPDKPWDWHNIANNSFKPYYPKRKMGEDLKRVIGHAATEMRFRPAASGYHEAEADFLAYKQESLLFV